jgi:hypothetical protein
MIGNHDDVSTPVSAARTIDADTGGRTGSSLPCLQAKWLGVTAADLRSRVSDSTRAGDHQCKDIGCAEAAKARGKRLYPRLCEARRLATVARKESADRYSANLLPVIRDIQSSGIKSLRGVARRLAARGIPTARGGAWTITSGLPVRSPRFGRPTSGPRSRRSTRVTGSGRSRSSDQSAFRARRLGR